MLITSTAEATKFNRTTTTTMNITYLAPISYNFNPLQQLALIFIAFHSYKPLSLPHPSRKLVFCTLFNVTHLNVPSYSNLIFHTL